MDTVDTHSTSTRFRNRHIGSLTGLLMGPMFMVGGDTIAGACPGTPGGGTAPAGYGGGTKGPAPGTGGCGMLKGGAAPAGGYGPAPAGG